MRTAALVSSYFWTHFIGILKHIFIRKRGRATQRSLWTRYKALSLQFELGMSFAGTRAGEDAAILDG